MPRVSCPLYRESPPNIRLCLLTMKMEKSSPSMNGCLMFVSASSQVAYFPTNTRLFHKHQTFPQSSVL